MSHQVAVAMAVHAGADSAQFRAALESIANQSYRFWHLFLFVDGAVGESTEAAITAFERDRISVIRSDQNVGLAIGLNRIIDAVLASSHYDFIARMDADDISEPTRFARQVEHFRDHPATGLLGTWCIEIDQQGVEVFRKQLPTTHDELVSLLTWRTPFVHPSVMGRARLFADGLRYDPHLRLLQDVDLWSRAAASGVRLSNLPEYLVRFRLDDKLLERRTGWRYATCELKLRLAHLRRYPRARWRDRGRMASVFLLRMAPVWAKRLAYAWVR